MYGNSSAIPFTVCQKPDQMSYMVDFLYINNWNHTYTSWHYPFFCHAHLGMPQICHRTDEGVRNSPTSVPQNLSAPKGPEVLVAGTSFFSAGQTTLMITEARELLKYWRLVAKWLMTTMKQQLITWFLHLNEFLASLVLGCTEVTERNRPVLSEI